MKKSSLLGLIAIGIILSVYRISHMSSRETSWDVLGYYLPLPATFVHHDPMLNSIDWLKKVNDEKQLTGTLYMVSSNSKGEPMYFFLFGMAFLYLPFFWIGHLFALFLSSPADGFSLPYQYAMVMGGILYMLTGLFFLRKNLRHFFSENITLLVMLIIVFSTNYIHHMTLKNLETVNVLFMLVNIVLWYTIRWHENQKLKYLVITGLAITLMALVKPSEIIVALIPLMWNARSRDGVREKMRLIKAEKKQLLITLGLCFLMVVPQMLYWTLRTGFPVYDSYKNPGIGLDLFSPHILDVLFSYRKGWLLYTPVMIFSLAGFYFLYKENRKIFLALSAYFLLSFYIISSWTEWWYGAAFSCRPVITAFPILAVTLGYFLAYIGKKGIIVRSVFLLFVLFFTFMNQFQWWQLKHDILDPYRTTKSYYWATFLKTSVTDNDRKLLLIGRDFTGKMSFDDRTAYLSSILKELTFDKNREEEGVVHEENGNAFYRVPGNQEFALTQQFRYRELTGKDHLWVIVSFDLRYPEGFSGSLPCIVTTMDHHGGSYGYFAPEIKPDSLPSRWKKYSYEYLTPEIRNRSDYLKIYFWNRGSDGFDVDNFKIEVFEKITD
jgi:hypothetical protein